MKKLKLHRETLKALESRDLEQVAGGASLACTKVQACEPTHNYYACGNSRLCQSYGTNTICPE